MIEYTGPRWENWTGDCDAAVIFQSVFGQRQIIRGGTTGIMSASRGLLFFLSRSFISTLFEPINLPATVWWLVWLPIEPLRDFCLCLHDDFGGLRESFCCFSHLCSSARLSVSYELRPPRHNNASLL